MTDLEREMAERLAEPFDPKDIGWKPQTVKGARALAVAFIDARNVMDRLDEVVGPFGWRDAYRVLADGNVECTLELRLDGQWVPKVDVGGESDQKDEGDKRKAAYSDALKRAAVKWGIGRYLYSLPSTWTDFDPNTRQIPNPPKLPPWALPKSMRGQPASPRTAPAQSAQKPAAKPGKGMPKSGEELKQRLESKDQQLAGQGKCKPGDLVRHVVEAGVRKGLEKDLAAWTGAAISLAIDEVKAFEAQRASGKATQEQHLALDGELERTGETWLRCKGKLGDDAPASMDGLTFAQADRLLLLLKDVDTKGAAEPPARGGKK